MLSWIKQLFGDPNGDNHEAVEEFRRQKARSNGMKTEMDKVVAKLQESREAVKAKSQAIREEGDRVSKEGLQPAVAAENHG